MSVQSTYSNDKEIQNAITSLIKKGKSQLKRTAQETINFGKTLISLKELIKDTAAFNQCVLKEFGLNPMMAHRFIRVAERFGDRDSEVFDFGATVLYLLAQPTTNESIIEKAIEKAKSGEKVTVADFNIWKQEEKEYQEKVLEELASKFGPAEPEEKKEKKVEEKVEDTRSPQEQLFSKLMLISAYLDTIKEEAKKLDKETIEGVREDLEKKVEDVLAKVDDLKKFIHLEVNIETSTTMSVEIAT